MATKREREMEQEIKQAMRRTWEYIAGDTLQMIREQDGRRYATKEEVIEMVLDAGRTERELERAAKAVNSHDSLLEACKEAEFCLRHCKEDDTMDKEHCLGVAEFVLQAINQAERN